MSRTLCPDCGANRGVQTSTNLSFCHSCHKTIFNKSLIRRIDIGLINTLEVPKNLISANNCDIRIRKWLAQYYINEGHIAKHNIMWSDQLQRIVFLYNNGKSAWARSITPKARNKWLHLGDKKQQYMIWKYPDKLRGGTVKIKRICIVEDCISAIRCGDILATMSLGGTNISQLEISKLQVNIEWLTWFDGDKAGQKAAEAFRKKYKLYLNIRNIVTKKDPKCHTPSEIQNILENGESTK